MKGFFFTLLMLIVIAGLCAGGYFAVKSMTKPASYIPKTVERVGDLHSVVTDPDTTTTHPQPPLTEGAATPATVPSLSSSNTDLAANINAMITAKTTLKSGNKNANVGYVQQFMNLYFKKTSSIDSVFGKSLKANVTTFQKQNKISPTGIVGPSTLQMMALWLKNHPK